MLRNKDLYETFLEASPDCIIIWDMNYNCIYANNAVAKYLGTTRDKVVGKNLADGFGHVSELVQTWINRIDSLFSKGGILQVQDTVHLNKELVQGESVFFPIKDSNDQCYAIGVICREISKWRELETKVENQMLKIEEIKKKLEKETKKRQNAEINLKKHTEELTRSTKKLKEFISMASHDLQEPLRKIQAFSDRLKTKCKDKLNDKELFYLERMQNAAERMRTLINELVYAKSPESMSFVPVDIGETIRAVLTDLNLQIKETDAKIEIGILPTISADPDKMRQLFRHLLSNALKYHKTEEKPIIKVFCPQFEDPAKNSSQNLMYQICIKDNGIGFDEKYTKQIFQSFKKLHGRGKYNGSGLGLSICKKIAELHFGWIKATSTLGKGSVFTVTLPKTQFK